MRSQLLFQGFCLFLAIGTVSSFGWVGMVFGAVEGLGSGLFKGTIGAFSPLAKEGLGSMLDFFGGLGGAASEGAAGLGSAMNGGLGAIGGAASEGFGGIGSIFNQIISAWGSIFTQLFNGGGDIFGTLFGILKTLAESFFSILGSLSGTSRVQVNSMFANTGNTFASVMKLKLNPQKNADKLKKEMLAVQKIMESRHSSPQVMVKAVKAKAPQLSAAVQEAWKHASLEIQKHMKTLNPEAKKGVQQMRLQAAKAKLDIGSIMSTMWNMMGGLDIGSMMSTGMSIISNLFGLVKMFLPI
jgi:hypothetical protein